MGTETAALKAFETCDLSNQLKIFTQFATFIKCCFFYYVGKTNIVRILADDEQVETDPSADNMNEPVSSPTERINHRIQKCQETREAFRRTSRNKCFGYSKLCHYMFIVLQKRYCLPLSLRLKRSGIVKVRSEDKWKVKSTSSVIYMTGASELVEDKSNVGSDSAGIKADQDKVKSSENIVEALLPRETILSDGERQINAVTTSFQQTVSMSSDHTSLEENIVQTGLSHTQTETILSTSSVEIQSKTTADFMEDITESDSLSIKPTPTAVNGDNMVTMTTSEATPTLPGSWKPDTKDVITESTEAGNQQTRQVQSKTTSAKVRDSC